MVIELANYYDGLIMPEKMSSNNCILIYLETNNGEIEEDVLEVLSKGRQLADKLNKDIYAIVFSHQKIGKLSLLFEYGADNIYSYNCQEIKEKSIECYEEALFDVVQDLEPAIILFAASIRGNDLACRLAARLKLPIETDCIDLAVDDEGHLLQTKLTHGGRASTTKVSKLAGIQISTVKAGAFDKIKANKVANGDQIKKKIKLSKRNLRIISEGITKEDSDKIGIDEADIIVSGGRGMGSIDNFQLINMLATKLQGVIGASLGAVDEEFAPRKRLVGQTGTTVEPDLYVACGISGSIYHILGMKNSKAIIAINKDPSAPIFKCCDMGFVGDAIEILPAIIDKLAKLKTK